MEPRQKILIVDDDEVVLGLFRAVLEADGCAVVQARDGVEALEKFDTYAPDLVLLDLMLPRLNGFEICSRLRRNVRARNVPIIMLSGLGERDAKLRALENGVTEFLTKPVERTELLTRVRAALRLRLCHQCRQQQQATLAQARQELRELQQLLANLTDQPAAGRDPALETFLHDATQATQRLANCLDDHAGN